jgi:hypothetical protein
MVIVGVILGVMVGVGVGLGGGGDALGVGGMPGSSFKTISADFLLKIRFLFCSSVSSVLNIKLEFFQ